LHLLAMALLVLAPDVPRLANVLIFDRATVPRNEPLLITDPVKYRGWTIGLRVLAGLFLALALAQSYVAGMMLKQLPSRALYGIYVVRDTMRDGTWVPLTATDGSSWRRMTIGAFNQATIRMASDSTAMSVAMVDSREHTLKLDDEYLRNTTPRPRTVHGFFTYAMPSANELILSGHIGTDSVRLRLQRMDEKQFLLMNRGFHWIQEQPLNR
jgi:hypothetical protein